MNFFLGGYYLLQLRPLNLKTMATELAFSCSTCFNDNMVEDWSYSWVNDTQKETEEVKQKFGFNDDQIASVREWVDARHLEGKLGWRNVFADRDTALEYRNTFFSHVKDIKVISLYFDETEARDLVGIFTPKKEKYGEIGLSQFLSRKIPEKASADEKEIGYDLVGVEISGDLHTFHCHEAANVLIDKFGLQLNEYGLFDFSENLDPAVDYMNDPHNGFEQVPWFYVKVKQSFV